MTPDERNMLADLANKIAQTPAPPRDPEAEDFIRKNIGARPDALYLMTQTVLIQNMALQQSQHQIQELQQRASQPVPSGYSGGSGSFLGQSAPSGYGQQQYGQNPQYQAAPPQYAPQPVAPPASGMSGFLRGAAQTAAGVAAGTLAVQGIESLFSHHSGFGGGEGMFGGGGVGGYGGGGETIIENNYYGDPQGGGNERFADSGDNSSVDIGPQDDDYQTQDDSYDANAVDDSSYDDSGSDDNFA
jgi:hypothetical protein